MFDIVKLDDSSGESDSPAPRADSPADENPHSPSDENENPRDIDIAQIIIENEQLKSQLNQIKLREFASKELAKAGLTADEETLSLAVKDTLEGTQAFVSAFKKAAFKSAEKLARKAGAGKSPKAICHNLGVSKEDILKISDPERRAAEIINNKHLFY